MRAVVLVGGEGTRLRPLTYSLPKQMLPVVEVPLIERVLAHLVSHGVTDVVLSLGYRPDAFIDAFPDGTCAGATLAYAVEEHPLDTAGAIRYAAAVAGIEATFLVCNGDVLTDLDVSALVAFHRRRGAEGTIALTPVEDPSAFGVVPTAPDGRVLAFIEKPAPGTAPTDLINAGTYVLEPTVLGRIAPAGRVNVERETFPAMVEDGTLFALASDRYWLDVGTPDRYLQATADILAGRRPGPPVRGARPVGDGTWALGEPRNEGTATCSFLGDGAALAPGAVVDTSVVGRGAAVGEGSVVEGSVLFDGASVEKGAEVRNCIIGPGAVVSAGAVVRALTVVGAGAIVAAGSFHEGARLPA
jgi:NDP-sugar pyrophosphorylase family protein